MTLCFIGYVKKVTLLCLRRGQNVSVRHSELRAEHSKLYMSSAQLCYSFTMETEVKDEFIINCPENFFS
jgi:hypothetical protein